MQIKKRTYFFRMLLCLTILSLAVTAAIGIRVYAAPAEAVKSNINDFNNLTGEAGYIQNKYDACYTLDIEETGLFDTGYSIINSFANMLFSFIKWLGRATTSLFYFCMTLDIAELFQDEINTIQEALNSGIFQPLFVLAFCFTALVLLKKFMKRDLIGAYGQIAKVIFLVVLSIFVVRDSSTVLSYATGITKSISTAALTGVNNQSSTGNFGADSAGVLWINLIHQPWITIQFGSDQGIEEEITKFMDPNADRDELVKKYMEVEGRSAFNKKRAGGKVGFMFLYLIPFLMKCVIYIVISMIQLVFQLLGVFYILLAPVILILSMIPGYDGLLGSWVRKILESQLSILVMTFLMGLLIKFDGLLYAKASEFGWLVVMMIQVVVAIGVVLKRDAIFGALSKMHKSVTNPGYAVAAMRRGGDAVDTIRGGAAAVRSGLQQGRKDIQWMRQKAYKTVAYGKNVWKKVEDYDPMNHVITRGAAARVYGKMIYEVAEKEAQVKEAPKLHRPTMQKKETNQFQSEVLPETSQVKEVKNSSVALKQVKRPSMAESSKEPSKVKIAAFNESTKVSELKIRPKIAKQTYRENSAPKPIKTTVNRANKNEAVTAIEQVPSAERKIASKQKQETAAMTQKSLDGEEVKLKRPTLSISGPGRTDMVKKENLQRPKSAKEFKSIDEQRELKLGNQ